MFDSPNGQASRSPQLQVFPYPTEHARLEQAFRDDGYVVLRGAVGAAELDGMNRMLTDEFRAWNDSKERFRGGGLLSGHLNCYPGVIARDVMAQLQDKGIIELAQSLLPIDRSALRVGCNFNLPGSVEQHYHVDSAFLEAFMIVNVAIVDTDLQNGAIDIIPGTHKRFYKFWEFTTGRVARGTTRVCMARGDVLIRPSTLWHRGMPNRSSKARPMLAVTLGEKQFIGQSDPFAHNGGRIEFQMNWFRPSKLGRLRERATVAVPAAYSAYRFARSLFGNKGYASY